MRSSFDAVVLAGGAGRRLGGRDKAVIDVGGRTLLGRVLAACHGARDVVVVGRRRPCAGTARWTCEHPPGGGPLAGLVAGVSALRRAPAPRVAVLACDLPYLTGADLARLDRAVPEGGAAVFVDDTHTPQPLAAVYDAAALRRVLVRIGDPRGRPARRVLDHLPVVTVPANGAADDCDTPEHLRAALRRWAAA